MIGISFYSHREITLKWLEIIGKDDEYFKVLKDQPPSIMRDLKLIKFSYEMVRKENLSLALKVYDSIMPEFREDELYRFMYHEHYWFVDHFYFKDGKIFDNLPPKSLEEIVIIFCRNALIRKDQNIYVISALKKLPSEARERITIELSGKKANRFSYTTACYLIENIFDSPRKDREINEVAQTLVKQGLYHEAIHALEVYFPNSPEKDRKIKEIQAQINSLSLYRFFWNFFLPTQKE